ncbi:MAG: beta-galactosidase, partial [Ignisphaera sp.]
VAFVEVLNEYGMIFGWLDGAVDRLPNVFRAELQKKWNEYLRQKYASTENLRKTWGTLGPDESIEQGTVKIFTTSEYRTRSAAAQRDWIEFLWHLEYNFFTEMYRYLKEELRVKALIVGTQVVFGSTPNIQQLLDVVDTHHYWRYPEGSGSDFYVVNDAMVNSPTRNTITSIAYRRVYGKPFMVSEYNHPAPNMYRSEAMVFLPAYGAYQDWDAIVFYSYGDAGGSFVFNSMRMR